MIINDIRGGGAKNTRNFLILSDEAGEAKSRITGRVILIIGRVVGFVDNNETEIFDGGKKGGTGANNDLRSVGVMDFFPNQMALGLSLTRVHKGDLPTKSFFKNPNKLGGESDFRNQKNGGFLRFKGVFSQF